MKLTNAEKQFVYWTLEFLVSKDSVNINPEGRFFFRKKFFKEMEGQMEFLTLDGQEILRQLCGKVKFEECNCFSVC